MTDSAPIRRSRPSALVIAARLVAAVFGGYGLAWLYTVVVSLLLVNAGLVRSDAVAWATLTSYAVMLVVALWAFAARSLLLLWGSLALLAIALLLGAFALGAPFASIFRGA